MDLASGTRFGPYEILSRIGAGGMGVVYRARDTRLGREVAFKVLHAEFSNDSERLRRFEQEARATSSLNHPNILSVFDVGTWEGSLYIISELLEGATLRERLIAGPFRGKKGLEFANQVARGLAAAHQKGIVHRDLKPENLFLTRDGRAKILDFGLAKLLEPLPAGHDEATRSQISDTKAGRILGTAGYMSPEQVRGEPADQRSDIFSFGAILYEMYSGNRAFRGPSVVETLNAILTSEPAFADLDDVPGGLDTIIRHCLEKVPNDRFQTVQDLGFNLEAIRDSSIMTGTRSRTGKIPGSWRGARTYRLGALILLSLAGAAIALKIAQRPPAVAPPATYTRLTFRQGNLAEARFAPDGRTVVYGAAWDGKPMQMFTTRIDGPESRSLGLPTGSIFAVSSQGMLAISEGCDLSQSKCRGTLAEVSIAGGAPRKLAENVEWADWSPDGKELVIVRPVGGRYRLEVPIGRVLYETTGWISNPRFSPDGKFVAFAEHPTVGTLSGSVSVIDRSGKKRMLSDGWGQLWGLAWGSNDEIWFNGSRTTRFPQLFGVRLDKSLRHVLSTAGEFEVVDVSREGRALFYRTNISGRLFFGADSREDELSWFDWSTAADLSADGKTLLFYEWGDAVRGSPEVYIRATDGSEATRLGKGKALALSPDGQWALALQTSPQQHLVLLPTGAGEKRDLPAGSVVEFYSATFFPGGDRILIAGEGKGHVPGSFVHDVETGTTRPVGVEGMPATLVSPDEKWIAAYGPEGGLYLLPLEGGDPVPIQGSVAGDRLLEWSEGGRALYVRAGGDEAVDIDRIDLTSGKREPWKRIIPSDRVGMIGVDVHGVCISRDGKSYAYTYWKVLHDLYSVEGLR